MKKPEEIDETKELNQIIERRSTEKARRIEEKRVSDKQKFCETLQADSFLFFQISDNYKISDPTIDELYQEIRKSVLRLLSKKRDPPKENVTYRF